MLRPIDLSIRLTCPIFFTYWIGVKKIKKFSNEYQTDLPLEVAYLKECGIRYSFVKVIDGVTVWKYEKTESLGLALAKFWKRKQDRR